MKGRIRIKIERQIMITEPESRIRKITKPRLVNIEEL